MTASTTPMMITNLPRRLVSLYSISMEIERASRGCNAATRGSAGGWIGVDRKHGCPVGHGLVAFASLGMGVPGSIWAGGTRTHRHRSHERARTRHEQGTRPTRTDV